MKKCFNRLFIIVILLLSLFLVSCEYLNNNGNNKEKEPDKFDKTFQAVESLIPMEIDGDLLLIDVYNDVSISYTSSNTEVLEFETDYGVYLEPSEDTVVTITITLTSGEETRTKEVIALVLKYEEEIVTPPITINDYRDDILLSIKNYYDSTDLSELDEEEAKKFEDLYNSTVEEINKCQTDYEIDELARNFYDEFGELVDEYLGNNIKIDVELPSYYDDIDLNLRGTSLLLDLRKLLTETHTHQTTYDELKKYIARTDADPNVRGNIIMIYSRMSLKATWDGGNTWNREHVWPQSKGWFKTSGAGSDIHHLRPEDPGVNTSRGNKPFGPITSSYYYCPVDEAKGDVARIIFYLLVRYPESENYPITNVAQSMDLLLRWNELDPVDDWERTRNEEACKIQGNRNPFIDCADFAMLIWGMERQIDNQFDSVVIVTINYCIIEDLKRKYV